MRKTGERIITACARLAAHHPWRIIAVSAVLTLLSIWLSTFLTVNTATDNLLANWLPFKQIEHEYRGVFPKNESLLVIVDGPTPEDADSAADNLAVRLEGLSDLFHGVNVPGTSSFFTDNGLLFLDQDKLGPFLSSLENSQELLATMARDPSLRGLARHLDGAGAGNGEQTQRLLTDMAETAAARAEGEDRRVDWVSVLDLPRPGSRPGTRRFVLAVPTIDDTSLDRAKPALDALKSEIDGMLEEEAEGVKVQVTGEPALRQQELTDAFSGAIMASALSFFLVALSLVIGLRSGRLIAALLITLVIGGVWTTALAAVTVGQLNLISVAFMVLFVGLGGDFGTYLSLRFLEERRGGKNFEQALTIAMKAVAPSITLATVCAILAFLSFVPTAYTGLAEFGIISALGMVVAFAIPFTLQAALMAIMPPSVPRWNVNSIGIGGFVARNNIPILSITALVTLAAFFVASHAHIDVNPLNLQNQSAPPVVAYRDLANDPQTSPYSLNVVAKDLADARTRAAALAKIDGVERVATAEQFLPSGQEAKLALIKATVARLGPDIMDAGRRMPPPDAAALGQAFSDLKSSAGRMAAAGGPLQESARALADGLTTFEEKNGTDAEPLNGFQEAMIGSLPDIIEALRTRLAGARELTIADLPQDIARDWVAPDGRMRLQVQPATNIGGKDELANFAEKIQAVEPTATGVPVSVTEAGEAILDAFVESILYTLIAITLVVFLVSRNLFDTLMMLFPLAIASIWTVAGSAILGLPFNFANVIVIPLLIGLGVSSSAHVVVRARQQREFNRHRKPEDRLDVLETSTSLAVLVTQLNTVAAFATLAISKHQGLYSMGLLLGIAILLVAFVSLVILPAALIALTPKDEKTAYVSPKPRKK